MNFDVLLSFWNGEHFSFWRRTKKEKTFSDKKLRVRTPPVRCSTIRLWSRLQQLAKCSSLKRCMGECRSGRHHWLAFWAGLDKFIRLVLTSFCLVDRKWASPGLLIDWFKTIEYFRFWFWSQNHFLFCCFSFLQNNLKSIAFPIVCEKGVILLNWTA